MNERIDVSGEFETSVLSSHPSTSSVSDEADDLQNLIGNSIAVNVMHEPNGQTIGTNYFESVVINLSMLVAFIISPVLIFIGYKHIGECTKQIYIPWFLLIAGLMTMISTALVKYRARLHEQSKMEYRSHRNFSDRLFLCATNLFTWFTFSFYILGCTWVYSAYEPVYVKIVDDPNSDYCDEQLYKFAFHFINSILFMIGVVVLWTLCSFMIDVIYAE